MKVDEKRARELICLWYGGKFGGYPADPILSAVLEHEAWLMEEVCSGCGEAHQGEDTGDPVCRYWSDSKHPWITRAEYLRRTKEEK